MAENEITNYLTLSRELFNHPIWDDKPFSKGQAWIDLIQLANYKDKQVIYKGEVITCKRGDVNLSILELSKRWGWSRTTVRRFLDFLEQEKMCTTECTTHRTTITLINYDKFNIPCATSDTTKCTTSVQQEYTTNKDIKENVKDKSFTSKKVSDEVKTIVDYLNERAGKKFRHNTAETIKHINARLREGYTVEDFKTVIDTKVVEWKGNPEMEKYLRPETLFGLKFESYLNQEGGKTTTKDGISEELKNYMRNSYRTIKGFWKRYFNVEFGEEEGYCFLNAMRSFEDEATIKYMVDRFREAADQDEISDFKEFTEKWLSENGNL